MGKRAEKFYFDPRLIHHVARVNEAIRQGNYAYATVDEMKVNSALLLSIKLMDDCEKN